MDDQEREWVRLARRGDRDAFASLADRYWERVRRWLYGLSGQAQVAEDMTQEAFLKAWTNLPRLEAEATFHVWLYRIARNCLLDSKRGPRGQKTRELPEALEAKSAGPLGDLVDAEAQDLLRAALTRLPDTYRSAYLLWTQEDLPYSEIAQTLDIAEETARWRVCKARQFLLKELRTYLESPKS